MDANITTSFTSSLPMVQGPDTFHQIPPNFDPSRSPTSISESRFQVPLPLHRQNALTPEKERKSDRVMKGVIGLNFRPGVEIGNGDRDLTSAPSASTNSTSGPTNLNLNHFYGFYWTCCNKIAEKSTVLGIMRGMMESAFKGLCKKNDSLAENKCGECGHFVCRDCEKVAEPEFKLRPKTIIQDMKIPMSAMLTMQVPRDVRLECSRGHIHKLAMRERRVSERERRVSEDEYRLDNMSKNLEERNGVIFLREASLERAEEEFKWKKNELLAPKSWFEQIQDWSENTSNCAQDGSSYGSYGSKPRSNSNGSLQPSRALDSGERPRRRRSSHSDCPTRPHEESSRTRRSSSASHHRRHDSNQPAIRITPPSIDTHSIPNAWGNHYEY
ncbi:hypothetical protein BPAE_0120g00050 [Botrytis paeoniae]|uniref:Uncharacterized protein n=1 Tax=Botrytis paeoniae TaxID=278948 RepID=A0A4Z1FQ98_9HELO|nr:hypothetical protein BPAE_0120g00050 [Botrytis paeoniae]